MEKVMSYVEDEKSIYCEEGIEIEEDEDTLTAGEAGFMSGYLAA